MNEQLKERILRQMEPLSDERALQVLDFVEFLQSKYAERSNPTNIFAQFTDRVQDTMRAAKLPINAVSGTVNLMDGATKVMKGLASAAATVVDEASRTAQSIATPKAEPPAKPAEKAAEPAPPKEPPG